MKLVKGFTYAEGSFFWILNNIFFQYYSGLILIICVTVMLVVSYLTEPPDYEKISGLTYGTTSAKQKKASRSSWTKGDVIASALLIGLIVLIYIYFTG